MKEIAFYGIPGFRTGHAQNPGAATGCSVILCERGAVAGVDVRGGSPGTRETDLLRPENRVERVHAVLLAGGSAFGLDAAAGVMRYLEAKNIGLDTGPARVPIVCGAVLYDLGIGDPKIRPGAAMGLKACRNSEKNECRMGSIGAGSGATVGKLMGMKRAMKGGLGTHAIRIGKLKVGALAVVNCLGDVIDPDTGEHLAGLLDERGLKIAGTEAVLCSAMPENLNPFQGNTTLGVVITNADLSKSQACKLASMAHDGLARTQRPSHTMFDGDTIFALARGSVRADLTVAGMLAAQAMERAVMEAVKRADGLCGLKSRKELIKS